jgi:hypothetical protein
MNNVFAIIGATFVVAFHVIPAIIHHRAITRRTKGA